MHLRVALVGILVAAAASTASAEKVKANQKAKLLSRAGEQGQVIMPIQEGQSMTVLAKDGRWLKVRVSGRTGFIPRSKVDLPEGDDDLVRNTRRRGFVDGDNRSTRRGFGGGSAPEDRVGGDAVGEGKGDDDEPKGDKGGKGGKGGKGDDDEIVIKDDKEPARATAKVKVKTSIYSEANADSDESFSAAAGDVLFPTGVKKGNWVEVENDEGDIGFVMASKVTMVKASKSDDDDDDKKSGGRTIDAHARFGFSYLQQGLRSVAGAATQPDNYNLNTPAAALSLGATMLYPYEKDKMYGGEVTYDLVKAFPIPVMGGKTDINIHSLNLRAVGGMELSGKKLLMARLGLHYQSYQVSDVQDLTKNTAKLPSENITSPMLGLGMYLPNVKPKISLKFWLDAMIGAAVTQTKNLEDGGKPGAKGVCVEGNLVYKWKPDMDIVATYNLDYTSLSFGAPVMNSQRGHTGTSVSRTDIFNIVTVGIGKVF